MSFVFIFLASNESIQDLRKLLEEAKRYHPNIKFNYEIDSCVSFLDIQIKNHDGNLITSVNHKQATEAYVVPFKSDYPEGVRVRVNNIPAFTLTLTLTLNACNPFFQKRE
jgi:hypothetical protein